MKSNEELLRTVLRSAKAVERIREIPIQNLKQMTHRELNISRAAHERLMACFELGTRVRESGPISDKLTCSREAIEFCRQHFRKLIEEAVQEHFYSITLNTKKRVINTHLVFVGTLDASLVHPREVFRPAIRDAAGSVLIAHNHPSGDPTPSKEDIDVTDKLRAAGEVVGIQVIDHLVMAKDGVVSIAEFRGR
jgi:DNA repair protein RadC